MSHFLPNERKVDLHYPHVQAKHSSAFICLHMMCLSRHEATRFLAITHTDNIYLQVAIARRRHNWPDADLAQFENQTHIVCHDFHIGLESWL